jgi:phage shock protein A
MTVMTRLARLVRADLNAVLDRLEAPELVLAQSVREMEQALADERRALAALEGALARLDLRDAELAAEETRTAGVLAEGLGEGREALTRPLVRRRLETAHRRTALKARRAEIAAERERLATRSGQRAARLQALRERAALDQADRGRGEAGDWTGQDSGAAGDPVWCGTDPGVSDAEVELELLRLRRQGAGS